MTLTCFTLDSSNDPSAIAALDELQRFQQRIRPRMRLQFIDFCPGYPEATGKREPVARQDRIVQIVSAFADTVGFSIEHAYMDQRAGRFGVLTNIK